MSTISLTTARRPDDGILARLNGAWHRRAVAAFGIIVLAHWVEHLVQAAQIWLFDVHRPHARGAVGHAVPWLVSSEWLHYGYAIVMLIGFAVLLPGFHGRSRWVWGLALAIQVWHHFEHALLLYQALADTTLFNKPMATSILQLMWQRAELHLVYNALVTAPMLVAMWLHMRPTPDERARSSCSCARRAPAVAAAA